MLTREFLDEVFPNTLATIDKASALSGVNLNTGILGNGLEWLEKTTEDDWFTPFRDDRPDWAKKPGAELPYAISASGLEYKNKREYLTAEGWPTGTRCWFVRVECGWRVHVAAVDPAGAVVRAIIVMCVAMKIRAIEPALRPSLCGALRYEMLTPVVLGPPAPGGADGQA